MNYYQTSDFNVTFSLNYRYAYLPVKQHNSDAGYDLSLAQSIALPPNKITTVDIGVNLKMAPGYLGMVCSRSGLAAKHGVIVLNAPGIIDSGFEGSIKIILTNLGENVFYANSGDRIAQLVFAVDPSYVYQEEGNPRGEQGLGSTGLGK